MIGIATTTARHERQLEVAEEGVGGGERLELGGAGEVMQAHALSYGLTSHARSSLRKYQQKPSRSPIADRGPDDPLAELVEVLPDRHLDVALGRLGVLAGGGRHAS